MMFVFHCCPLIDLSKNRLYDLPEDIGELVNMRSLDLNDNLLEGLPKGIYKMKQLETLNVSRNRLYDMPLTLCTLPNLRKLILERNKLFKLPVQLGNMKNLVDLRVGYNRIELLPEELFSNPAGLASSLKHFSCSENNLAELPNSMCFLDPELRLEADFNPLISPPPELMKAGLATVNTIITLTLIPRLLLYTNKSI
jgi:internalin A